MKLILFMEQLFSVAACAKFTRRLMTDIKLAYELQHKVPADGARLFIWYFSLPPTPPLLLLHLVHGSLACYTIHQSRAIPSTLTTLPGPSSPGYLTLRKNTPQRPSYFSPPPSSNLLTSHTGRYCMRLGATQRTPQ